MYSNDTYKILLVDDDIPLVQDIDNALRREGYQVIAAFNGKEGVAAFREYNPHLVLMDIIMPVMNGMDACLEMRTIDLLRKTFIVFYTDRKEDYSQIAGFNAGADDYIIKPVKLAVLLTRIKAILKRLKKVSLEPKKEDVSGIQIDRERYVVIQDGKEIVFPRKEFELVSLLHSSPRKVFTRQEISSLIWGHEIVAKNRSIDVHIRKLREKLGNGHIKTVKGIGYSFEF